jgi:hypothetical protein
MNYAVCVAVALTCKISLERKETYVYTEKVRGGTWVVAVMPVFQYEVFSAIAEDASNWVGDCMEHYDVSEEIAEQMIEDNTIDYKVTSAWLEDDEDDVTEVGITDHTHVETLTDELMTDFAEFKKYLAERA